MLASMTTALSNSQTIQLNTLIAERTV